MITGVILCFILGYIAIVLEHPLKLDKTVPALLMGAACWAFISLGHLDVVDAAGSVGEHLGGEHQSDHMLEVLLHHVGKIAEILFFLIGAMTIVELVDLHRGFAVITNRITTTRKRTMLILICVLAFFLSATLDNLASTIVLVSLLRRLVPVKEERIWFVCMAVIGANAGGAWSPIGDVTTTMLWISKKVTTLGLIDHLVFPAFVCLAVPVLIASFMKPFKGNITPAVTDRDSDFKEEKLLSSRTMLFVGIGALVFVPVFKSITHLPPYVGMMLSMGIVWLVSEYIHPEEDFTEERKHLYSAHRALSRIEMSSILFFLGILVAVAALESVAITGPTGEQVGLLKAMAQHLQLAIPNQDIVVILLGGLSAVIDNVPLVAASIGMYDFPIDHKIWHFIAYSAGTGGSMLIIGSAAGVAAMGMERIDFIWYLKNITWLAMAGFLAGAAAFLIMYAYLW
ncbi:MAG: sodium:proton antiporter NhaD [Saprospiraceae bacterium]|nr:sodium:proton antiporter NhaD [Saprospiraceae bacterium]